MGAYETTTENGSLKGTNGEVRVLSIFIVINPTRSMC